MKKIIITLITVAAIILFFFTGCDKYHRDRYTGTWEFVVKIDSAQFDYDLHCWIPLGLDSFFYSGKIIHGKYNDELIIQYTEQNEVTVWVNHNGNLWTSVYPIVGNIRHGYFDGNDKIYLELSRSRYGGILSNHFIEGIKKERRKK
jgi:hypothetical protein